MIQLDPRRRRGLGRAMLGAAAVVVLAVQAAPVTLGLLSGALHGVFHLTARTGFERLESRIQAEYARMVESAVAGIESPAPRPGAPAHGSEVEGHVHSHGETPHTHGVSDSAHEADHGTALQTPEPEPATRSRPAPKPLAHTHGPGREPHAHSPAVDAVLELARASESPAVGPTSGLEPMVDRYLHPDRTRPPAFDTPVPALASRSVSPLSRLLPDPPVPPPRA